jgi:hypothetical protein
VLYRLLNHVRRHAVGYVALFVALGGTSYAASQVADKSANAGSPRVLVRGRLLLHSGDSRDVIGNSAYHLRARCTTRGGRPKLLIQVITTVPNTLVALRNRVAQPGHPVTFLDQTARTTKREVLISTGGGLVAAPHHPALITSEMTFGFNYAGSDCFVSTFGFTGSA